MNPYELYKLLRQTKSEEEFLKILRENRVPDSEQEEISDNA